MLLCQHLSYVIDRDWYVKVNSNIMNVDKNIMNVYKVNRNKVQSYHCLTIKDHETVCSSLVWIVHYLYCWINSY